MTYSRSVSDSTMMVGPTISNGNHIPNDIAWTGGSERNGHDLDDGTESRQMTDSPPSNGASHAHAGGNPPICQNCGTSTTPLWRRNELGATLCNACGLFLKLHGRARPLNLKTDTIKSRNRVKSVTQPKKKAVFDGSDKSTTNGAKHMNGNGHNGYSNGHLRIEQHPKSRNDISRPPYEHYESSYSSQGYSYARSTASSTESGPEYSPPTAEPVKPYSPFYGSVSSPAAYPRGVHSPPYYPPHSHHSQGPPPLSLPPPTSHAERALPPPTSLLRQSPPPRRESPQLPPIFGLDTSRHLASHPHPHSPLVPTKRDTPTSEPFLQDQLDSLKHSNEQLHNRVNELDIVNDLMKSRVAELESSETKARTQVDNLKSELLESQARENELYRKMDKLRDELADAIKRRSRPSTPGDDDISSKRRKVSLSEIVGKHTSLTEIAAVNDDVDE